MKEFDTIVDDLRADKKPQEICQDIGLCAKQQPLETTANVTEQSLEEKTVDKCAYCTGVVTVLDFAEKEKPDQIDQLRAAAGAVCDLMPADDEVRALVNL